MNLSDMRTELQDRGFDYLSDTRCDAFLNYAYFEICDLYKWPFLTASASGAAPLTISDLGKVLAVRTDTTKLEWTDPNTWWQETPTGTPCAWFQTTTGIDVIPSSTDNLTVHYLKVPATLSADTDEPIIPERYQSLIIDGAVIRAYIEDTEFDAATAARADWQFALQRMVGALIGTNWDSNDYIHVTNATDG